MFNPVTFRVDGESGPVEVVATGLDYAAYESAYSRPFWKDLAEGTYTCQAYVVWHAMKRRGLTDLEFDAFLDTSPQFTSRKDDGDEAGGVDPVLPLGETTTSIS